MTKFGTLDFVLDKYSGTWCWKITGQRAVSMVSKLIPRAWYGDAPDEAIVSDNDENVKHLHWIAEKYPLDILSKNVWNRKILPFKIKKQRIPIKPAIVISNKSNARGLKIAKRLGVKTLIIESKNYKGKRSMTRK